MLKLDHIGKSAHTLCMCFEVIYLILAVIATPVFERAITRM